MFAPENTLKQLVLRLSRARDQDEDHLTFSRPRCPASARKLLPTRSRTRDGDLFLSCASFDFIFCFVSFWIDPCTLEVVLHPAFSVVPDCAEIVSWT